MTAEAVKIREQQRRIGVHAEFLPQAVKLGSRHSEFDQLGFVAPVFFERNEPLSID